MTPTRTRPDLPAMVFPVLAVGPISDSYGRRPIALIGLGLIVSGLLGSAVSINYEMMFAFRVITGLGTKLLPELVTVAGAHIDGSVELGPVIVGGIFSKCGAEHFLEHFSLTTVGPTVILLCRRAGVLVPIRPT